MLPPPRGAPSKSVLQSSVRRAVVAESPKPTEKTLPEFQTIATRLRGPRGSMGALFRDMGPVLEEFVTAHSGDLAVSVREMESESPLDVFSLLPMLEWAQASGGDERLSALALHAMKICFRDVGTRARASRDGGLGCAIVEGLRRARDVDTLLQGCGALVNFCLERRMAREVCGCGGLEVLSDLLVHGDFGVCVGAAGALQSVCFTRDGREGLGETKIPERLVELGIICERDFEWRGLIKVMGALQNISSDGISATKAVQHGVGPLAVRSTRRPYTDSIASSAGILQNIARTPEGRLWLSDPVNDAVPALLPLVFAGSDIRTQRNAVGALLNIIGGPEPQNPTPQEKAKRQALRKSLAQAVALGIALEISSS